MDAHALIIGGGCAGLSLAVHVVEAAQRAGRACPRVRVIEPRTAYQRDRTWCGWRMIEHPFAAAVNHRWTRWAVTDGQRRVVRGTAGHPYEHIPADAFYALAQQRLAAAPAVTLQLGELTSLSLFGDPPSVYMVSGTPGGASSRRCVERLRDLTGTAETLRDCLLVIEPLPVGPFWRLLVVADFLGLPDALPLTTIPIEAQSAQPSLFPEVRPFELTITGLDGAAREQVVSSGGTVLVAPGDTVEIDAPVDALDSQLYYQTLLGGDGLPVMQAQFESITSTWLLTDAVAEPVPGVQQVTWQVPEDAEGAIHGYYLLGDTRSIVWAWLRFEVTGAPGSSGAAGS